MSKTINKETTATLLAAALLLAAGRASAQNEFMTVVAADGSGDYTTLQEAVDACSTDGTRNFIFLRNGTYEGNTQIAQGIVLSLIGESRDGLY